MSILKIPLFYISIILYFIGLSLKFFNVEWYGKCTYLAYISTVIFLLERAYKLKKDYLLYALILIIDAISLLGYIQIGRYFFTSILNIITPFLISILFIYNHSQNDPKNNSVYRFIFIACIWIKYIVFFSSHFSYNIPNQDTWYRFINFSTLFTAILLIVKNKTKHIGETFLLMPLILQNSFTLIKQLFIFFSLLLKIYS